MFSSRWAAAFIGLALVGVGGWQIWEKRQAGARQVGGVRLAVLPCENATSEDALGALAASEPRLLQMQLEAEPSLRAFPAPNPSDAIAAGATHLLHLQLTQRQGKATLEARLEDAGNKAALAQGGFPIAAAQWNAGAGAVAPFVLGALKLPVRAIVPLPAEAALRDLAAGFAAASPEEGARLYESAAGKDPKCGWCWVAWAESAARLGGNEKSKEVLARFRAARPTVDAGSAARLELLEATLGGQPAQQVQALWKLAGLRPNDTASLVSLAGLAQRLLQYDQAEKALARVVQLEPATPDHWNTLAYVQANLGKTDAAVKSVAEYERLAPASANPLDSRGEILFMAGRFAEAESAFLACARKEPDFNAGIALEKAALARMMNGDVSGASTVVERYIQQRMEKQDALAPFHRARWDWMLGHRGVALERMKAIAESGTVAASLAASKLAVWGMESGDEGAAREWARMSAKNAKRPGDQMVAVMALSVSGLGDAVRGLAPQTQAELAAIRLTLQGSFPAAAEAWQKLGPGGANPLAQSIGAWAQLRAGQTEAARKSASAPWPILPTDQYLLFDALVYQSVLYTRAELAREANRTADAQKMFDVYLRSMGDAKDRFGQMAKARGEARL